LGRDEEDDQQDKPNEKEEAAKPDGLYFHMNTRSISVFYSAFSHIFGMGEGRVFFS
jgi:hypothetical protein